jgi:hypothetical protein
VADADDKNPYLAIENLGDDAIVADSVLPELAEFVALQRSAQ